MKWMPGTGHPGLVRPQIQATPAGSAVPSWLACCPRYSARKVQCTTSRYHVRDQDRPCQSVTITRVQITIQVPPPDRAAARPRGRKDQPPEPRQPRPDTRRDKVTRTMASQHGHDWAGRDLAALLGIKPRNMLTRLAEWTRLGFLAKTGPAGTRSPPLPAPRPMRDRNPAARPGLTPGRQA